MPTYDYQCSQCGPFEARRPVAERNAPALCPGCGTKAERVLVSAPRLAAMASDVRAAMATNERASHEPRLSSRHPGSCSCCKSVAKTEPSGPKTFANKRPWMISH